MKILIIDDSKFMRFSIGQRLKQLGWIVFSADNGKDGFGLAYVERPDIVLLDVMMPVMDGFETCMQIRKFEELNNVKIIMVTSKAAKDSVKEAIQLGADDYIVKPFKLANLLKKDKE